MNSAPLAWTLLVAAVALVAAVHPVASAVATADNPLGGDAASNDDPALAPFLPVADAPTNRGLVPQRWVKFKRTHYYQIPPDPVGTIVIFHGCVRAAKAFFPWNPDTCPECLGYPEHVSHSKQALAAGYAVLALEPLDSRFLCWSSSNRGKLITGNDQPTVRIMVEEFLREHDLMDKPLLLHGASSGGTLALKFAGALEAEAEAAKEGEWVPRASGVISEESVSDFGAFDEDGKPTLPTYPPTMFIVMSGGGSINEAPAMIKMMRDAGVPADSITSPARAVVPTYLSDRIPAITQQQSEWIAEGMTKIGMLDKDGWLLGNPDRSKGVQMNTTSPAFAWDAKLKKLLPWLTDDSPTLSLKDRKCGIQQALNVAYSRHDAVSDYLTVCIKWIDSKGKANLDKLLDKYTVPNFNLTLLTIHGVVDDSFDFGIAEAPSPAAAAASGADGAGGEAAAEAPEEEQALAPAGQMEVRLVRGGEQAPLAAQVTSSAGRRRPLGWLL